MLRLCGEIASEPSINLNPVSPVPTVRSPSLEFICPTVVVSFRKRTISPSADLRAKKPAKLSSTTAKTRPSERISPPTVEPDALVFPTNKLPLASILKRSLFAVFTLTTSFVLRSKPESSSPLELTIVSTLISLAITVLSPLKWSLLYLLLD